MPSEPAKKKQDELLHKISESTSGLTGQDFIVELCRNFTAALNMQFAVIAECLEDSETMVHTVCMINGNTVMDNIEYDVRGRPCEIILQDNAVFIPEQAYKRFPNAVAIEAATGVPIHSSVTGKIIGHIIVSNLSPVAKDGDPTELLKVFASRVGAEMERIKAEKKLSERSKENEFYRFTMENLRDAVFWVGEDGYIWKANSKASELSGYSSSELLNMHVFELNKTVHKGNWKEVWTRLKKDKKVLIEAVLQDKSGVVKEVEITQNYIEFESKAYTCSIVRDIRQRKLEEELLRTISERTAGLTGEDYFKELTKYITATFNVRYSMVVECTSDNHTKLRTISYIDRQQVKENVEYDIAGTPCEIVMKGKEFFCGDRLEETFPKEKGIKSWIAVPIFSPSSGKVIGNIAAFDEAPMRDEQNQTAVLRIFAARAGAELDRLVAEEQLRKANVELKLRLQEIEELKNQLAAENKYLQEEIKLSYNFDEIVSKSTSFRQVLQHIEQVSATDATVLILGESGTGKELLARAVHNISNRSKRPLVKVNCAALPANLIESELFGHEKGAFTGAMERKIGRFELADGGTIFLDEIGELPIELQSKLLRVLQEGEFERLGNPRTMKVNVRVIAATNRNLEMAIEKKEFREDLYYRLNVFPINCPPLRDRKEDIPLLVKHFCQKYESKIGKKITSVPAKVMDALMLYNWPGNIRELENIIERALILSRDGILNYGEWIPIDKKLPAGASPQKLEDMEKQHILATLKKTGWKVSGEKGAAKILGLNATTLEARMKKLGITRETR